MAIGYKQQSSASVTIPPNGAQYTFIDAADGKLKRKDSLGNVVNIEDAAGGVTSFEGRSGSVVAAYGDYQANEVVNVPNGNLIATDVQAAINELDSEKVPMSHVGSKGAAHDVATIAEAGFISASDKAKLDGIAAGATVNQADSYLKDRANHTGTQSVSTITGLATVATSGDYDDLTDKPILATVATSGQYSDLVGTPSSLPPTGSASGELAGSYPSPTLLNSAVVAKILTGLNEQYGQVQAIDSILIAFSKMVHNAVLHKIEVNNDLVVPSGYEMIRGETKLKNGYKIRLESGSCLKLI